MPWKEAQDFVKNSGPTDTSYKGGKDAPPDQQQRPPQQMPPTGSVWGANGADPQQRAMLPVDWNYKDANKTKNSPLNLSAILQANQMGQGAGPGGQKLPPGALSWDPNGEAYYGEGMTGAWNKFTSNLARSTLGNDAQNALNGIYSTQDLAAKAVNTLFPWAGGNPSAPDQGRGQQDTGPGVVGSALGFVFDGLQLGTKTFKQGVLAPAGSFTESLTKDLQIGATTSNLKAMENDPNVLAMNGQRVIRSIGPTLTDAEQAYRDKNLQVMRDNLTRLQSLPTVSDWWMQSFRYPTAQERADNPFWLNLPMIERRSAAGEKAGLGELKQVDQQPLTPLEAAYLSGRMFYTTVIDPARKAELVRRVEAGENPNLVAIELENPLAEMVGETVLDPLNFIPFHMIKEGWQIASAQKVFGAAPEVLKAVEGVGQAGKFTEAYRNTLNVAGDIIGGAAKVAEKMDVMDGFAQSARAVDDVEALPKFAAVVDAVKNLNARVVGAVEDSADASRFGLFDRTLSAKVHNTVIAADETLSRLRVANSDNPSQFWADVRNLAKLASDDADDVAQGTAYALKSANPSLMLSENGMRTGKVAREMIGVTADGTLDVDAFGKALAKAQAEGPEAVLQFVTDRTHKAVESIYPKTLTQNMTTTKLHNFLQHEVVLGKFGVAQVNSFLANLYMGPLSPAFAVRNFTSNMTQMMIDEGPGVLKGMSVKGNTEAVERLLGFVPEMMGGFDVTAKAGVEAKAAAPAITQGARAISNWAENWGSANVYRTAVERTFDQMWQLNRGIPDITPLKQAGFSDGEIAYLIGLARQEGSPVKAAARFLEEHATGNVYANRSMDVLMANRDKEAQFLKDSGLWDDIEAAVRDPAATAETVTQAIDAVVEKAKQYAAQSKVALNSIDPNSPMAQLLDDAKLAGFGDTFIRSSADYINANDMAMKQMSGTLYEVRALIANSPNMPPDIKASMLEKVQSLSDMHGKVTEISPRYRNVALSWQDTLAKAPPANRAKLLDKMWADLALPGNPPALKGEWNKEYRKAKDVLWNWAFENRKELWNNYRDTLGHETNWLVKYYQSFDPSYAGGMLDNANLEWSRSQYFDNLLREDQVRVAKSRATAFGSSTNYARVTAFQHGINPTQGGKTKDTEILTIINKYADQTYGSLKEVPPKEIESAFFKYSNEAALAQAGVDPAAARTDSIDRMKAFFQGQPIAPHFNGTQTPFHFQAISEQYADVLRVLEGLKGRVAAGFDAATPTLAGNPQAKADALKAFTEAAGARWNDIANVATGVGDAARKFTMLDYGDKTYLDTVMAYIMPYQYWYSRTYANWMKRLVYTPGVLAAYGRYKDTMAKVHAGAPDWWKYNINSDELLGIKTDNPLFFNLEQSLWPLNGITGTDFNDPVRRFNSVSTLMDDASKWGPSLWMPFGLAMAVYAQSQGNEEAAARWAGRLIPQSNVIKTTTAALGIGGPGGLEIDPFVNAFSKGIDPYERNRVGRVLGQMYADGQIDYRTFIEAAKWQGDKDADPGAINAWNTAKQTASLNRAGPNMTSYLFGLGFKGRSRSDMQIDQMDADRARLMGLKGNMTPDEYRNQWQALRTKFPFMDGVLLSRKSGNQRDDAYAYNVLARIPPGRTDDFAKSVGLDYGVLSKFYDSKGDTSTWTAADRDKLHTAMTEMGAMLNLPDNATQSEYASAKAAYAGMRIEISNTLGAGVWEWEDKYNHAYFDNNPDEAARIAEAHPEVFQLKELKRQLILSNPVLATYYGSLDDVDKYYNGKMYSELEGRFGADIYDKSAAYYDLQTAAQKSAYLKANPELKQYWDLKTKYEDAANAMKAQVGSKIAQLQPKFPEITMPGKPSVGQTNLQNYITGQQTPQKTIYDYTPQDWISKLKLSESTTRLMMDAVTSGKPLSKAAQSNLDYSANKAKLDPNLVWMLFQQALANGR